MQESTNKAPQSRVHKWVHDLETDGDEFQQSLATNFSYYLNHLDEFNQNELEYSELPELEEPETLAMDAAIRAGISWGKESALYIVTGEDDVFVDAFGIESNAEACAEVEAGYSVTTAVPNTTAAQEDVEAMKAGQSELLPQIGECIEQLIEHEDELENGEFKTLIKAMPHFEDHVNLMLLYSTLFGRLWEYSDPAIWVILGPNSEFEGLSDTARNAAVVAQDDPDYHTTAITPRDNDRHAGEVLSELVTVASEVNMMLEMFSEDDS